MGALALVNLLVLLTAATQMNASYLFFASWADLSGALTGHLVVTSLHRGASTAKPSSMPVAGHAAPVAAQPTPLTQPASPGGLVTYVVHGARSGLTGTVLVQLPPGYSSRPVSRRYPVLEALHGYPGTPSEWTSVYHLPQDVQQLVSRHQLRQPLIVMPQIQFPAGVDTEGVNGPPGQPQVETWLTRDVPAWIGQHFPVAPHRSAWATIGLSAGGFDAAMATILHPAQYGAAIVLGGYYRPSFGPFYQPFGVGSPAARHYDLPRTVAGHPPPVSLWVQTSHADKISYRSSVQLLRAVRAPMAVHAVILRNAGHRASVWIAMEPRALQWLGLNIAGFRPTPHVSAVAGCGTALSACGAGPHAAASGRSGRVRPRRGGHHRRRGAT